MIVYECGNICFVDNAGLVHTILFVSCEGDKRQTSTDGLLLSLSGSLTQQFV
jgi:hypothetical protein